MEKKEKPHKEFSKKIFDVIMHMFGAVLIFSMALMWKTENTEALAYLIPAISGLAATVVGFYMWKSKAENLLKIAKDDKKTLEELKETMNDTKEMINELSQEDANNYGGDY